jgi:hypothetical protein
MQGLMLHAGAQKLGRQDLLALTTPASTETHTVIPHSKVVEATLEALAYRRIEVVSDEYGVSKDGAKFFGVMTLDVSHGEGGAAIRLALAFRNSHDKTFSLGMVAGFRVFCCDNLAFSGDFFAIAKKHSKKLLDGFQDTIAIGVDRVQRNFAPMQAQVDAWKNHQLPDIQAREIIYKAFVEDGVDCPKHLAKVVHGEYFEPKMPEFEPRTVFSLQNAFTSAFKQLEPVPQYRATASLGEYFAHIH